MLDKIWPSEKGGDGDSRGKEEVRTVGEPEDFSLQDHVSHGSSPDCGDNGDEYAAKEVHVGFSRGDAPREGAHGGAQVEGPLGGGGGDAEGWLDFPGKCGVGGPPPSLALSLSSRLDSFVSSRFRDGRASRGSIRDGQYAQGPHHRHNQNRKRNLLEKPPGDQTGNLSLCANFTRTKT